MKSEMKHTPGPWTVDKSEDARPRVVRDANGRVLLHAMYATTDDVRLIAAAPDQHAALEVALDMMNSCAQYFTGNGPKPEPDALADVILAVGAAITKASRG